MTARAVWAKRVERWQDCGLSSAEFAAEIGVSAHALRWWKYTLRHGRAPQNHKQRYKRRRLAALQRRQPVTCANPRCRAQFVPIRSDKRYCKHTCSVAVHDARIRQECRAAHGDYLCGECGRVFEPRHGHQKYCGRKCSRTRRRTRAADGH